MCPGQKRNKPTRPNTLGCPTTSAYSRTSLPANRAAPYLVIRRLPVQQLRVPTHFGSADSPILPRHRGRTSSLLSARRPRRFAARCPPRSTEPAGCLPAKRARSDEVTVALGAPVRQTEVDAADAVKTSVDPAHARKLVRRHVEGSVVIGFAMSGRPLASTSRQSSLRRPRRRKAIS